MINKNAESPSPPLYHIVKIVTHTKLTVCYKYVAYHDFDPLDQRPSSKFDPFLQNLKTVDSTEFEFLFQVFVRLDQNFEE